MHVGAKQADEDFIKEHVQRIADDPDGLWVYLGDGGECVTKTSKGELYEQQLSPDEQIERLVELLEPVRGKGLFGVSGNHDRRIAKLSGIDWTHALCARLGIPYLGIAAFMRLVFILSKGPARARAMRGYDLFWHHGADSSSLLGGKVNAAKKLERLVIADGIFSAHSHICVELPPSYMAFTENREGVIKYKETRNFVCGCAYDSRVPGYAMEKAYPPILPAYLGVTYRMKKRGSGNDSEWYCKTECQIWRKDV
jgi:hypothetical protein